MELLEVQADFWSGLFCLVLAIAHWILEAKLQAAEEIRYSINLLTSNVFKDFPFTPSCLPISSLLKREKTAIEDSTNIIIYILKYILYVCVCIYSVMRQVEM